MKNFIKLLTLLLVLIMLVQSTVLSAFAAAPNTQTDLTKVTYSFQSQTINYSDTWNSGVRFMIATTLNGTGALSYYTGSNDYDTLSQQSASTILSSLRNLMTSTHKKNSSYDDCWNYADNADCQNEDGKVYLIYTNVQTTLSNKNSGWNREHVWPKSLGGYETSGPGADLHHIRPSDNRVNSCRNNLKYGEVSGGKQATGGNAATGINGGFYNSSYFEPHDAVKGDVARICLYMYVRYGGSWSKCSSITNVFQSVDVLLDWCELDPVDTWELGRNEVVEAYQGNRNVFIDYPEYAWLLFGKEVPADMTTPSGKASEGACSHNWSITASTKATCTAAGSTTYTCSYCNETKTESVSKLGHSFGSWVIDVPATETTTGSKHRICSRCDYSETLTIPIIGHEHSYTSTVTAPTCTEKGYTTHKCACGESYIDTYTNTVSHSYAGGVCSSCGAKDPNAPTYTKEDFSNLITSLVAGKYSGQEKYNKICEAANIYNALSDEDKNLLNSKYDILISVASQYNEEIKSVNNDASVLDNLSITVVASASVFAAFMLLKKKEF